MKKTKDFVDRLVELIRDDKKFHDATVWLINAMAAEKELKTDILKKRRRQIKTEQIL